MDYIKVLDQFNAAADASFKSEAMIRARRRATLQKHRDLICIFPDLEGLAEVEFRPAFYHEDILDVLIDPKKERAEEVRSLIQSALGVFATRSLNVYDGSVSYVFKIENATITSLRGRAASTCEIVPEQVSVTRYKMVCPDPPTSSHNEIGE